jgi:hypothetical protein
MASLDMAGAANDIRIGHRLRRREGTNSRRFDPLGVVMMIRRSETFIHVFRRRSCVVRSFFRLLPELLTLQRRDAILGQVIHWRMHALLITTQACAYSPPDAVVLGPAPAMPGGLFLFHTES